MQSFAGEANLLSVQRAALLLPLLLTSFTGLGCASTELGLQGRVAGPPEPPPAVLASIASPLALVTPVTLGPAAPASRAALREATSSRADAAAYLTLRSGTTTDVEPEDRR